MREGLLWYDDSPKTPAQKVALAAIAYRRKFGEMPNACYVHPSASEEKQQVGPVEVAPLSSVLKYHFWIGQGGSDET